MYIPAAGVQIQTSICWLSYSDCPISYGHMENPEIQNRNINQGKLGNTEICVQWKSDLKNPSKTPQKFPKILSKTPPVAPKYTWDKHKVKLR